MEYQRAKLDVYIDPSFLIQFFNNEYVNDEEKLYKINFKIKILKSKNNKLISAYNGNSIPNEEYSRLLTSLEAQIRFTPDEKLIYKRSSIKYNVEFDYENEINNPSSIFLTSFSNELVDKLKTTGYLFFNTSKKKWLDDFRRLSFNCEFSTTVEVKPDHENPKSYGFEEYEKYSLPTNTILLIDPWITTWPIEKIKTNIFKLFDNLFFAKENRANNKIKIVSLYDKHPNENYKPAKPKDIKREFSNYFSSLKIDIEVIYIKYFKYFKIGKNKRERDENEIIKYKDLFTICEKYFHDRHIFSNYIYYQSGRSLDPNMYDKSKKKYVVKKYHTSDLFSILNRSKFQQINTYIDIYNKLSELKQREDYKKFFED